MNLAHAALAIAGHLIPLTPEQRDDVIVRALCVVDDGDVAQVEPRHPVTAGDDVPRKMPRKKRVLKAHRQETPVVPEPTPMLNGEPIPMRSVPVTPEDYPDSPAPARPSRGRVASQRLAASSAVEAAARSIVDALSGHPEGLSKGQLAAAINFEIGNSRYLTALRHVVSADRIRAEGHTNQRRYYPAGK